MKWRRERHRCALCNRPAVFIRKGQRARARNDHDLCPRCFRGAMNRLAVGHEGARARGRRW